MADSSSDDDPDRVVRLPDDLHGQLAMFSGKRGGKFRRFFLAALGSLPWVGGLLGAVAGLDAESDQQRTNSMLTDWIQEHRQRLDALAASLAEIASRLDQLGPDVEERIQSEEYLTLVRQGFRVWDEAATPEKKKLVRQLLSNAGGTQVSSDDVVRLFLEWISYYHEAHFAVIRHIYRHPGSTRGQIWDAIRGTRPREDSAEADLFKLLIRDLSTGSVIRQHREVDGWGNFVKRKRRPRSKGSTRMKSAFDEHEPYELTELGQQFVHYCMNEIVPRMK